MSHMGLPDDTLSDTPEKNPFLEDVYNIIIKLYARFWGKHSVFDHGKFISVLKHVLPTGCSAAP